MQATLRAYAGANDEPVWGPKAVSTLGALLGATLGVPYVAVYNARTAD